MFYFYLGCPGEGVLAPFSRHEILLSTVREDAGEHERRQRAAERGSDRGTTHAVRGRGETRPCACSLQLLWLAGSARPLPQPMDVLGSEQSSDTMCIDV